MAGTLLRLPPAACKQWADALGALPPGQLQHVAKDPGGCRVLEAYLEVCWGHFAGGRGAFGGFALCAPQLDEVETACDSLAHTDPCAEPGLRGQEAASAAGGAGGVVWRGGRGRQRLALCGEVLCAGGEAFLLFAGMRRVQHLRRPVETVNRSASVMREALRFDGAGGVAQKELAAKGTGRSCARFQTATRFHLSPLLLHRR